MNEEWSSRLMDKLAGELSEKEAAAFEANLSEDESLQEEYQFFANAWEEMDQFTIAKAEPTLSESFYQQLDATILKQENSLPTRVKKGFAQLVNQSGWVKNLSFGLLLLAVGFILGGKLNKKTITVNSTTVHTSDSQQTASSYENYTPISYKLASVKRIPQSYSDDEGFKQLVNVFNEESNTNIKLVALREMEEHYSDTKGLRDFLALQLQRETSPLVQVEIINLLMYTDQSRETIRTMESMLRKRQLNPVVEDKIRNDLPVLKASFVK